AEDGIRDRTVTGVQTCALPIYQTIGFIPAQFTNRTHGARLSLPIPLLTNRISEGGFQLCAIAKRFDELQRDNGGSAIRILGRHTEAEVFSPVDEGPQRYALEESVRSLSLEEPIQDSSRAGYLRFHEFPVPAIKPKVMYHADPQ